MVCAFSASTYSVLYSGSRFSPSHCLVTVPLRLLVRQVSAPPLFLLLAGLLSYTFLFLLFFTSLLSLQSLFLFLFLFVCSFLFSPARPLFLYRSFSLSCYISLVLSRSRSLSCFRSFFFSFASACFFALSRPLILYFSIARSISLPPSLVLSLSLSISLVLSLSCFRSFFFSPYRSLIFPLAVILSLSSFCLPLACAFTSGFSYGVAFLGGGGGVLVFS